MTIEKTTIYVDFLSLSSQVIFGFLFPLSRSTHQRTKGCTLHSLDFTIKLGDVSVVCDAGGSTVDLISYQVTDSTRPQLQVKELSGSLP